MFLRQHCSTKPYEQRLEGTTVKGSRNKASNTAPIIKIGKKRSIVHLKNIETNKHLPHFALWPPRDPKIEPEYVICGTDYRGGAHHSSLASHLSSPMPNATSSSHLHRCHLPPALPPLAGGASIPH
jgi:hypothetical protein